MRLIATVSALEVDDKGNKFMLLSFDNAEDFSYRRLKLKVNVNEGAPQLGEKYIFDLTDIKEPT
jgi:hypothetical protein